MINSFGKALSIMFRDKVILLLSLIPIVVGSLVYFFAGQWLYSDFLKMGRGWIEQSLGSGSLTSILYYLLVVLVTIALYFVISWTFVIVVSIFAAPFNDIISSRVERIIGGKQPTSFNESFKRMLGRIGKIFVNEIKKIIFIIVLNSLAFVLSFIPILVPVSMAISAILMGVAFIDYSWSRHEWSFANCFSDLRRSLIPYTLGGGIFLAIISVPFVNLLAYPYGIVYFTVLFSEKNRE